MNESRPEATTLVVGIGSHHGDDQAGWRVAERLADRTPPSVLVRTVRTPSQLLNWLEGIERLILCDACHGGGNAGDIRRWEWPTKELQSVRWLGSHDVSLPAILQLAERLQQLPARVVIWSVEIGAIRASQAMSAPVMDSLPRLVEMIEREWARPSS